tara:strand:+ start:753 stop:1271 length:519 start_codon:yes stop_codon:yes gene_type:complete
MDLIKERVEKNRKRIEKYTRPDITITDIVQSVDEIKKQLKDYIEIELNDIDDLPKYTYVKYITFDKNKKKELFRFGGKIIVNKEKYIVLKGFKCNFCVQKHIIHNNTIIYNTRFFKKKDNKNEVVIIKNKLNDTIDKANNMYIKQQMEIKQQKDKIKKLKIKVKKLQYINKN